jgi:tetratricopeptide (TPR) repeat protein
VLAAVLTGRPPFVADTSESTRVKAAQGDISECFARLDACGADPDLVALCRRCLAPRPEDRPSDAGAVAAAVAALRAAADERARRAELDRVQADGEAREAVARAAAQRQRRRTLLIAGGIIALVLLAGLGGSLWQTRRAMQALAAEQEARQDETKAREQAFAALRIMAADVVERKFAQGTALTEDDRAFLRDVIAQFDAFAAIKGDGADSRAARAEGRLRVGNMRSRLGELQQAEQDYDQAVSIYTQLATDFPSRAEFREQLSSSHNSRGLLRFSTGRLPGAEKDWNDALSIQKRLAAEFPARPEFRHELARTHNNRAALLRATGRPKEAEKDYDEALGIQKQLAADFPARLEFRQELAGSHINRGSLLREMGRPSGAERDCDEALAIQKRLAAEFPARPEFRHELVSSLNNRGLLLSAAGRLGEAEKDYDEALSIQKQLAAEFPARPDFRQLLARSLNNRANLLTATARLKEAEKDFEPALSIVKQLAADFPNQPDIQNDLAATCVNLALVQLLQRNWIIAKRLLLDGRPYHLAALKANPMNPIFRQFYRNHLSALTAAHAGLLEQEDANRTADTCRSLGWDPAADAYDAACALSLCVPIVVQHDKLDATQRKEAAQFYGDAAMRFLRDAVSKGYKDEAHMKKDTDLDSLRQRDDFRKLVADLEGKGR